MSRTGKRGQAKLTRSNVDTISEGETLDELFNIYIYAKEAEGLAKTTIQNKKHYYKTFSNYLKEYHSISFPDEVTVNTIRELMNYLKNDHIQHQNNPNVKDRHKVQGVSIATVNSILRHMKAFYNFLIDEKYVGSNPLLNIKQLKEVSEIESLSIEQVKALLKQPDQRSYAGFRDYVMMFLLLDTGMRISEAIGLRREDIDLKTNVIELRSATTKNRKTRYVPITQKTNKLLRELLAETEEFSTPFIFTTVYGNPIEPARFRQRIKKYGLSAGIKDKRCSPHTFRHTFAKQYLLNNGDIMTLQKILGHSSIEMVRKYVNMTDKDIFSQHNKFSPMNYI
jgi:integrase/recombinase XerD